MATATFVSLSVRNSAGQIKSLYLTASDVTTAALVFPSGGTEISISSLPCVIYDMIIGSATGDTSQIQVYMNGVNTGLVMSKSANAYTTVMRQCQGAPISIPASATLKLVQVT